MGRWHGKIATPGNGVSGGTLGNWDTTLTNWDQGSALAHVAWSGTTNIASFAGTAGTVTLTAPVSVGGLSIFSNSGYTIAAGASGLTFGTGTNNVRMLNVSGATSTATISGAIAGGSSSNLIFTSVAPDVGSTLTFSGTGGWSGTTAVNAGFSLALDATSTALLNTSAITLKGGTITQTYSAVANRINDSAAITSYGGTLRTNNSTNSAINYSETVGAVTLESGQTNFVHTASHSLLVTQNIILGSLTRNGTSAVTFAGPSGLASPTKNLFTLAGATATTAGQIIGSWATTGNTSSQFDYAVYNASSQVVSAVIAASDESTWGTSTDTYTSNAGLGSAAITLSGTRNIAALKSLTASSAVTATNATDVINLVAHTYVNGDAFVLNSGTAPTGLTAFTPYFVVNAAADTFQLSATQGGAALPFTDDGTGLTGIGALLVSSGNNLGTAGILNASGNTMYIAATGTGVVTLPSISAGQLHVSPGVGPIVIYAPITNNTGALTLVKNGGNTLTLFGTNTYSGGTVLNAGSLVFGNVSNIGGASANLTFGGTATLAPSAALNFSGGTLTVNEGAYGTITGNGATAFATTTGSGTLRYTSNNDPNTLNLGNASGFTGNLQFRLTSNAGYTATGTTIQFSSLGDGVGSALQIGGGQSDSTGLSQRANIVLNGSAALEFDNRQVEILPRIATNHTVNTTQLRNDSSNSLHTWIINTDLSYQVDQARSFELAGSNTGNNAFNGLNTYDGLTTVNTGTLGGSGTIAGNVTVAAAGSLAPGASAGTLSIGGVLDISAQANGGAGKLKFELGPVASSDKIALTGSGSLTIGGNFLDFNDFSFSPLSGLQNGTYKLITSANAISGGLDTTPANLTGPIGAGTGILQISGNDVELLVSGIVGGDPYATWSGGADFDADANNDGVDNGVAWVLGAADPNANAIGLQTTFDNTTDPDYFIYTYRRADEADTDPNTTIAAEYGTNLGGWTPALDNANIDIIETDDHYAPAPDGVDRVVVKFKRSTLAPDGVLFVRLKVVKAP